jgi:hypothetical protein
VCLCVFVRVRLCVCVCLCVFVCGVFCTLCARVCVHIYMYISILPHDHGDIAVATPRHRENGCAQCYAQQVGET